MGFQILTGKFLYCFAMNFSSSRLMPQCNNIPGPEQLLASRLNSTVHKNCLTQFVSSYSLICCCFSLPYLIVTPTKMKTVNPSTTLPSSWAITLFISENSSPNNRCILPWRFEVWRIASTSCPWHRSSWWKSLSGRSPMASSQLSAGRRRWTARWRCALNGNVGGRGGL